MTNQNCSRCEKPATWIVTYYTPKGEIWKVEFVCDEAHDFLQLSNSVITLEKVKP